MNEKQKYYYSLATRPQMFSQVMDNYPGLVVILSSDKKIQYVNKNFLKLTGYSYDEVLNQDYFKIFTDFEGNIEESKKFEDFISKEGNVFFSSGYLYTKAGKKLLIVWNNFHLEDNNKIVGMLSFGQDITFREEYINDIEMINKLIISLEDSCIGRDCYLEAVEKILSVALKISGAKFVSYNEIVDNNLINIHTEGIDNYPEIQKIDDIDCYNFIKSNIYELEKEVSDCDREFIRKHSIEKIYYRKIKTEKGLKLIAFFYDNKKLLQKRSRISILTDIIKVMEERREFAERLIVERNRFFVLAENLAYAVMSFSTAENKIEYVNKMFVEITGYESDEILDKPIEFFENLIHQDDLSSYREYFLNPESHRRGINLRIKTKEGEVKDINILITAIKDKENITDYILNFRDITYELIQKRQVNEYTKKLLMYSNIDSIFIKYSPPVLYKELLNYTVEITGYREGLIGFLDSRKGFNVVAIVGDINRRCKIGDKIDLKNNMNSNAVWAKTLRTGETYISDKPKTPQGHIFIKNVVSLPIKYSERTIGVIMLANKKDTSSPIDVEFLKDITSYISQRVYYIIQNENLLKEREERLMDEFEAKSMESLLSLTGGLAHDFNNLLLPVTTNISLFKEKFKENEEISEDLKEIDEYINAAQSLAKQLLSISNPKTQGIKKVNVKQLIETSVEFVGRGLLVKIDLEIDESIRNLEMFLPKNQIIQVLTNIILNSAQALSNSTNPKIIVRSYIKDNNLFIEIEDNGPGIKEEYRDLLFKPYFTTKKEGRGLGLFMSYSIVKNLGGDIDFETEEGKGTKFIIQIPVKQKVQDSELKSINVETEKEDEFSGINALIIDDEKFVLKSFSKLMKFFKVNVFTAENSQEAIDIINNNNIDILVVDLMLKGDVKGNELNKKIKEIKKDIFSVASSGYTDDDTIMHFKKYHFDYVLPKPYRIDDIKKMLIFYKSYKRKSL